VIHKQKSSFLGGEILNNSSVVDISFEILDIIFDILRLVSNREIEDIAAEAKVEGIYAVA